MLEELRTGWRYVAGFAPVRSLLLIVALVGVMGMPYATLMPVIASKVLHGGPHTLGILMTASGIGALAGTLYLASRHTVAGLGKVIVAASGGLSLGLIAFSFSRSLWLCALLLPIVGAGMTIFYGALACLAGCGWFALRRPKLAELIRPIYLERGIIVDLMAEEPH